MNIKSEECIRTIQNTQGECGYCFSNIKEGTYICLDCDPHVILCKTHLSTTHREKYPNHNVYLYICIVEKTSQNGKEGEYEQDVRDFTDGKELGWYIYNADNGETTKEGDDDALELAENLMKIYNEPGHNATPEQSECIHLRKYIEEPPQREKLAITDGCHGADCEITQGLWVCLDGDYIGCERKYYDGSGGESHALKHHEDTGHLVTVKIGTLRNPHPDIYCYKCDMMVTMERERLLGILKTVLDVEDLEIPREKSILEMTYEKYIEVGRVERLYSKGVKAIQRPGICGMENPDQICYIISVLQIYGHIPEIIALAKEKESMGHFIECNEDPNECFKCQFIKIILGISTGSTILKLTTFVDWVYNNNFIFQRCMNGDVVEFLDFMQDMVEIYGLDLGLSRFIVMKNRKCLGEQCSRSTANEENNTNMILTMAPGDTSIDDAISRYFKSEEVEYNCECGATLETHTNYLKNLPNYLFVVLNRVVYNNTGVIRKITAELDLGDQKIHQLIDYLYNKEEVSETPEGIEQNSPTYALKGGVIHLGSTSVTGHYVTILRDSKTQEWLLYNDSEVLVVESPKLGLASLLVYQIE